MNRSPKSSLLDRAVCAALLIPFVAAMVIHGSTKPAGRASVSYPRTSASVQYLIDRGSYVTNDFVHFDFERRIVPDSAELVIERRQYASTNDTDWAEYLRTTFAEFAVPTNLPCANATNWNWVLYADWTPPPTVHTNGILEVKWGTATSDAELRARGIAVGIPVQTTAWVSGEMVGTPGGTNSLPSSAATISETAVDE